MVLEVASGGWWERESYTDDTPIPQRLEEFFGPQGTALVKVYSNGSTQKGWGPTPPEGETEGFMPRYLSGEFQARRALHPYNKKGQPFAFVMRSMRLVCIDIDGKNGGLSGVQELGSLPYTLAEKSKSGNGYHLFYFVPEDWDEEKGFARTEDKVGIAPGVDIRGTGCVYHYPQQRWNDRDITEVPAHLLQKLDDLRIKRVASQTEMKKISHLDDQEKIMAHAELLDDLAKPIAKGKRNTTLFAIGSRLMQADVPAWDMHVRDRAGQVGMSETETDRIIENIGKHGYQVI